MTDDKKPRSRFHQLYLYEIRDNFFPKVTQEYRSAVDVASVSDDEALYKVTGGSGRVSARVDFYKLI